jgi:small GTP-binding protein
MENVLKVVNEVKEVNDTDRRYKQQFQSQNPNHDHNISNASLPKEEIQITELNQIIRINPNEFNFKILFLGDMKVGKTSLISMICDNVYKQKYLKTICCDTRFKKFKINERFINIQFYDIGGDINFEINFEKIVEYMKIAHSCVFVTDMGKLTSLTRIEKFVAATLNTPNFLIMNKTDLINSDKTHKILSSKSPQVAEFQKNANISKIFETSLKEVESIQKCFNSMLISLVEFYENEKNVIMYMEKFRSDNVNIDIKYKINKKKKNCWC